MTISFPKAILLDMDGVLYHGERTLPYAAEFVAAVSCLPHIFITNNPILPPEKVANRLAKLGIANPEPENIVTSAQATADWLARQKPGFHYFAVGAEGLHIALCEKGVEDSEYADFVVVGEGKGLNYETLTTGLNLILNKGATLIGTNPDITVDATQNGKHLLLPGGGSLIAPFAVASQTKPVIIGKPEPGLYQMALQRLRVQPQDCIMVGDQPNTDILGAQKLGMRTALVRTGRFLPGEILPDDVNNPDWDVTDLEQLLEKWQREFPQHFRNGNLITLSLWRSNFSSD